VLPADDARCLRASVISLSGDPAPNLYLALAIRLSFVGWQILILFQTFGTHRFLDECWMIIIVTCRSFVRPTWTGKRLIALPN
jgi:hypothetical protein